jgi:hypothetical protein
MSDLTGAAAQAIEQPHGDVITILLGRRAWPGRSHRMTFECY